MNLPSALHPHTREFLRCLYAYRAAHLMRSGRPLDEAKAEASTLALSFRDALLDGSLVDMGVNVAARKTEARV